MTKPSDIAGIRAVVQEDLNALDTLIKRYLHSDIPLVQKLSAYIINSGGKRIRPLLHILIAHATGYTGDKHILTAAILEFIHTATLLHDDVVDESDMRRGQKTANEVWGNAASVLVGDFLYSRAFQMMVEVGQPEVMAILASTTNRIAEGEVLQLMHVHNPETTEAAYFNVIEAKTGVLFEAACDLGGLVSEQSTQVRETLRDFGRRFGICFQLMDDLMDYEASPEEMGKNIGDDLAEGKATLPLIYALNNGDVASQALCRGAIESGDVSAIHDIREAIETSGGLQYTRALANEHGEAARACLATLDESPYRESLMTLLDFGLQRKV